MASEGWQYAAQRPDAKNFVEQKWGWVSATPGESGCVLDVIVWQRILLVCGEQQWGWVSMTPGEST